MTTLENTTKETNEKEKTYPKTQEPTVEVQQKNTKEDDKMMEICRKKYKDQLHKVGPDFLLRLVRGYAHEEKRQKATFERIDYFFKMYDKYDFTNIHLDFWEEEEKCLKGWPVFMYGEDRQGHPIMYDEMATLTPSDFEKAFGTDKEKLRKFRFRFMRRLNARKQYLSKKYGKTIYKHILVMNVSAAGVTAAYKYKNLAAEIISEEQHLFPETLYKLYIVNTGWVFSTIWSLYSTFADPITVKKVQVLKGQYYYKKKFLEDINEDQIPKEYGGTGKLGKIRYGYDAEMYDECIKIQNERSKNKSQTTTNTNTKN